MDNLRIFVRDIFADQPGIVCASPAAGIRGLARNGMQFCGIGSLTGTVIGPDFKTLSAVPDQLFSVISPFQIGMYAFFP